MTRDSHVEYVIIFCLMVGVLMMSWMSNKGSERVTTICSLMLKLLKLILINYRGMQVTQQKKRQINQTSKIMNLKEKLAKFLFKVFLWIESLYFKLWPIKFYTEHNVHSCCIAMQVKKFEPTSTSATHTYLVDRPSSASLSLKATTLSLPSS